MVLISHGERGKEYWLFFGLLILAAVTRLVGLTWPAQVVFDEVHFGKFISAYCCTGEYFFDIHPPHAKLLIAGVAALSSYDGDFSFSQIGQAYGAVPVVALRLIPALSGLFLPLVFFILIRQLRGSLAAATVGGLILALDNGLIVQSRVISLDGLLLLAIFGSLVAWLAAEQSTGWKRLGYWVLAGLGVGLAVGSKFTGLVAPAMVGLLAMGTILRTAWRQRRAAWPVIRWQLFGLSITLMVGLVVYGAGWMIHYWILPLPGPGDAWQTRTWSTPLWKSFFENTREMHQIMFNANYNLTAKHSDESPWWSWPLMLRPVYYWQGSVMEGKGAAIYFWGNPIVWWGSTVLLVSGVISLGISRFIGQKWRLPLWLPLAGYAIAYAPFIRIPRALFLYHYLTPLLFAVVFVLLWSDEQGWLKGKRVYWWAGAVVAGWVCMLSVTYALPTPGFLSAILAHLPRW